jgi:hypothetical protein
VDDPDYRQLCELLMGEVDFVFEEACGYSTSASTIAKGLLGPDKYADINPPERSEAAQVGATQELDWRDPRNRIWRHFHIEQEKREAKIWLEVLREHSFGRALLICGYLHLLTMANRLSVAGYEVDAVTYTPWNRLCQHESRGKVLQVPGENPNSGEL